MKFANDFDIEALEDALNAYLSLITKQAPVSLKVELIPSDSIRTKSHDDVIYIESQELADTQYPRMFESLKIVVTRPSHCWTKIQNTAVYWLSFRYSYKYFDGGSNSSSIADVYIDKHGKILEIVNNLITRS